MYSGLCYRPGGDPAFVRVPRDTLPPGTNVLETGDFGKAENCSDPQCGSDRAFIQATACSGQDLAGATVTRVWVCASLVAECGCQTIKVGRSTNEPWICWQANPGPSVDEDEIGVGPTIVKIVDTADYCSPLNQDGSRVHSSCCDCVSGCAPTERETLICAPQGQGGILVPSGRVLRCCCDTENYRLEVTNFAHSFSFTPHPPQDTSPGYTAGSEMIQSGVLVVENGSIVPSASRPTILRVTEPNGNQYELDLGYPSGGVCAQSPYDLPRFPSWPGAAWVLQEDVCPADTRNANGDGVVTAVSTVWECDQRVFSTTQRFYEYGGFLRITQTYAFGLTTTYTGAGRCTGNCAQGRPAGATASRRGGCAGCGGSLSGGATI